MRGLKYRVYDKIDKCYSDKAFSIDQLGICYIQDEDGYWEEIDEDRYIVEQYTGLEDKNGKEICEGDIVKYETVYEGEIVKGKGVVNFGNLDDTDGWTNGGYLCWRIDDWLSLNYGGRWIGVVGNIHENPKLLKKEK